MTNGPWLEVAPIALGDVSIIPESPESTDGDGRSHNIALWAVSDKGDVLCRLGVSELNPVVSTLFPATLSSQLLPKVKTCFAVRLGSGLPRLGLRDGGRSLGPLSSWC